MDKQTIDDNDIEIKYLRKQLTPEQTEQFEIYLMEHPEMLEQLELGRVLVEGSSGMKGHAVSNRFGGRFRALVDAFGLRGVISHISIAIVGVGFGAFVVSAMTGYKATDTSSYRWVELYETRGAVGADVSELSVPVRYLGDESNRVALMVDTGSLSERTVSVEVYRADGAESSSADLVAHLRDVNTNSEGLLLISLNAQKLEATVYRLKVLGGGLSKVFYFKLIEGRGINDFDEETGQTN